ncbi:MAG: translocation/assembly module TamB domain-containing protein [Candidatus Latescibacterota bacterium]
MKRFIKWTEIVLGGIILLAMLSGILLLMRPVREKILSFALNRINDSLPGNISIDRASWPTLGSLEFAKATWSDQSGVLLSAERIAVSVNLLSLIHKDVQLKHIEADINSIDVSGLTSLFSNDDSASTLSKTTHGAPGFPRMGSIPGVPSIAVDHLLITAHSIRLNAHNEFLDFNISGSCDFLRGHSPKASIEQMAIAQTGTERQIDTLTLDIDIEKGLIHGFGRGILQKDWPFYLSFTPHGTDSFTLILSSVESGSPPDNIGLELTGSLTRELPKIKSLTFHANLRTPGSTELSRIPALSGYMDGMPALEGIALFLQGSMQFEPALTAEIACDVAQNNWLEGGKAALTYNHGVLDITKASFTAPGLTCNASAQIGRDSVHASATALIQSARWLQAFRPQLKLAEPLSAGVTAYAILSKRTQTISTDITASARTPSIIIDELHAVTDIPLDSSRPAVTRINARAKDINLHIAAEIDRSSLITVRLAPVMLRTSRIADSLFPTVGSSAGTIIYSSDDRKLSANNVRFTGDGGDIRLNARLNDFAAGTFDIACNWPEAPTLLLRAFCSAQTHVDTVQSHWLRQGPFRLLASGNLSMRAAKRAEIDASFKLPGPSVFASLLPDSVRVTDLGPIEGQLALSVHSAGEGISYEADLDLNATDWVDASHVRFHGRQRHVIVDTIVFAMDGVQLGMSGTVQDSLLDLQTTLNIAGSDFARRFVSKTPDMILQGKGNLGGSLRAPLVNALINASVHGSGYRIPQLAAEAKFADRKLAVHVMAPLGAETPYVRLNRIDASFISLDHTTGLVPARLIVSASGEKLDFFQSMLVDTSGGLGFDVDSLSFALGGRNLRTEHPFHLQMLPEAKGISIGEMDLSGSMGNIRATGLLRPDSSRVTGHIEIAFPAESPSILIRKQLWPDRLELDVSASGRNDISLSARITGFTLVTERSPIVYLHVTSDSTLTEMQVSVADSISTVLQGQGSIPVSVTIYPPAIVRHAGPLSLHASFDRFPMTVRMIGSTLPIPEDEVVQVNGRLRVGGTMESLIGDITAQLDFADWPRMSKYRLNIQGALGPPGLIMDSTLAASGGVAVERSRNLHTIETATGLLATLILEREDIPVVSATMEVPLALSLNPPAAKTFAQENVHIEIHSESLPLEDFDPLFPDVTLGGAVTIACTGSGPIKNISLDCRIKGSGLEIKVSNQAQLLGEANINISGTQTRPVINGDIEIKQALIRVPDNKDNLHATEGEALLMRRNSPEAPADTILAQERNVPQSAQPANKPPDMDIDVNIKIPSGFWIRGKGLDLELSGNLTVKQQYGEPMVTGELRVIRGVLIVLGRTFNLKRGVVTFFGDDETNPSLDVVLGTEIEGSKIQITIAGTAQKPEMKFSSEPDMPEVDIMSVLLFGHPYGKLDDGQADLLKTRSTEMLISMGASRLQQQMGQQFGVDIVTVRSTGADNSGTALSVGKYINPQVLVSYAYSFHENSGSFVTLEYFFKGRFKVETIFGNQGQTSIGIGWSKEY